MPEKGPSPFPAMPDIELSTSAVQKFLHNLKLHNASGPDSIPTMVLKELRNEIAPLLEMIFRRSLQLVRSQKTGKKLM